MLPIFSSNDENTFFIHTVTMGFDPAEDRIYMDSSDGKGSVQRLWLSRRLLDKLIPTLTDQLEKQSTRNIPTDLEQSFAQEKAEINKKKTTAIKALNDNPSWLVTSVNIRKTKHEFQLVFIDDRKKKNKGKKQIANFNLATNNLRQWLNAIFKIYRKASWDTKNFPDWLLGSSSRDDKTIILN